MCWVCEGWTEHKFDWRIGKSGNTAKEPVYIHFDFDEYRPWLLEKDATGHHTIWKMIPPGKTNYFFSFGGENGIADVAKDQPHTKIPSIKHIRDIPFKEIDGQTKETVIFTCHFQLRGINYVFAEQQKILDYEFEPVKFKVIKPRLGDPVWVRITEKRPRTPWTFPISIFKDYQIENELKVNDCYEFDYA